MNGESLCNVNCIDFQNSGRNLLSVCGRAARVLDGTENQPSRTSGRKEEADDRGRSIACTHA
jgi:hypothetical protein